MNEPIRTIRSILIQPAQGPVGNHAGAIHELSRVDQYPDMEVPSYKTKIGNLLLDIRVVKKLLSSGL